MNAKSDRPMRCDAHLPACEITTADSTSQLRAIVLFEDRPERSALRLLRPGFRHCFCVIGSDGSWTVLDPLTTRIELAQLSGFAEHQLVAHYRRTGRTVVVGSIARNRPPTRTCVRAVTCVEIVKRLVNLDAPYAFTPFQLHRALRKHRYICHGPIDNGLE